MVTHHDMRLFFCNHIGKISLVDGKNNTRSYQKILRDNQMTSVEIIRLPYDWIFQQGNDPEYTTRSTRKWFAESNVNVLQWTSQSQISIPIENL